MPRGGARAKAGRKRKRGRRKPITKVGKGAQLRSRRIHFKRQRLQIQEKVISPRGRPHWAAAPTGGQPIGAQTAWMASTAIQSIAYDPKRQILQIEFVSGHIYLYDDVPQVEVEGLTSAMSKGRYFYYNIRTNYRYTRVK